LKIAIDILPGIQAGVGRWQRETIRALCATTHRGITGITAFSMGKRYGRPEWIPAQVVYRVSRLPGRIQWWLTERLGVPVERVCQLGAPDVILAMNLHHVRARAPVVTAVADVSWRTFSGQYRTTFSPTQIKLAECAIRRTNYVLTLSKHSADELVRGGVPADRIRVVHLGVGDEFWEVSSMDVARVKAFYQLPDEFVLHVGGINERKNLRVLIAALDRLGGRVPLLLAGPRPAETFEYWGLNKPWIRHIGYLPDADIPALFAASTVKVFPSRLEGYGLPLVEAMAAGTPVLAADTPVFREVAGEAACFFRPDDDEELARLILRAIESTVFREEYRQRGRELASRRTWSVYVDSVIEALRDAANVMNNFRT
jgi:glycosyltransferase involved in cell wall biosynthesis